MHPARELAPEDQVDVSPVAGEDAALASGGGQGAGALAAMGFGFTNVKT